MVVDGVLGEERRVEHLVLGPADRAEDRRRPELAGRGQVLLAEDLLHQRLLVVRVVDDEAAADPDRLAIAAQDAGAQRVERAGLDVATRLADEGHDPLAQLAGGAVRERDGEDLPRPDALDADQVRDPVGQDAGLARGRHQVRRSAAGPRVVGPARACSGVEAARRSHCPGARLWPRARRSAHRPGRVALVSREPAGRSPGWGASRSQSGSSGGASATVGMSKQPAFLAARGVVGETAGVARRVGDSPIHCRRRAFARPSPGLKREPRSKAGRRTRACSRTQRVTPLRGDLVGRRSVDRDGHVVFHLGHPEGAQVDGRHGERDLRRGGCRSSGTTDRGSRRR